MANCHHGPRISEEEYEKRIAEIYTELPSEPSRAQESAARRQELESTIDHRLGLDFPRARRESLWEIQRHIERRHLRFAIEYFVWRLLSQRIPARAGALAGGVVKQYAKVLNQRELEMFFGVDEAQDPALPVDVERIGR